MKKTGLALFPLGLIATLLCQPDTANAQTNALVASPQQLTFNTQTGVTTPSQNILLTSATGSASFSYVAVSDTKWLVVTPSGSSTPAILTVSIGPSAPTSGTDVGFINLLSGTNSLSIPVTLNPGSTGAPSAISANPNSVSFVFTAGTTVPQSHNVTISSSSSSVTSYTATTFTNNSGSWLSVTPAAGNLPNTLQVAVNPALLTSPGTFNGAVAVNAPGTTGISIPVLVTVQGTPSLNVSPAQLSFDYQPGTALPAAQNLTFTSSTGATVDFTANAETTNCGSNWIVLNQSSSATPSTLSVEINTADLNTGGAASIACTGEIAITADGASPTSTMVPINLLVSTLPIIQVPSTGPTFTYQIGGAAPAPQSVQITSTTSGIGIQAVPTPNNGGPSFLLVTPGTGTTPQSLTLSVNSSVLQNLAPGTYTETVTVSGGGAGNITSPTFIVTLTVTSNATLIGSAQSLNFNFQVGETAPSSQTITVTSSGAPVNYQVSTSATSCPGFLSATPQTGSTQTVFGTPQNQVVVSVNTQGITPQVCNGSVTLTVPGSTGAPLVIPVTLDVSNTALLDVGQSAISVTALAGGAGTAKTISVTSTNGSQLSFAATAATNPLGLTWLSVAPNTGTTPTNLQVMITPAGLGAGVYTGSVVVSSTTTSAPAQTISVTLTIFGSNAASSQPSLTFSQAAGGAAPETQALQISGVPTGGTIGAVATVLTGSSWLTATVSGSTVTVAANGAQLAQGTYTGVVTVIVPGAGASPLYIPVTLNVTAATSAIAVSETTAAFNVQAGSMSVPTNQTVQVTSTTGTSEPFTASFVPSTGGNFLTVTPSSGNTPATLTLAVDSAVSSTLAAGSYTGTVQVSSGSGAVQTVNVTLLVSATGTPVVLAVESAASFATGAVSPGEIVTLFGNSIGPAAPLSGTSFTPTNGTVLTTLAGVTVTFNGVAAPLIFVAPGQINAIVPYEVAAEVGQNIPVVVTVNGTASASLSVPVVATEPAIFSLGQNGSGQGAILNSDQTVNGTSNPAAAGSIVSIFATGEGVVTPANKTGCITGAQLPLPKPVASVAVTIGGQSATPITYAGEAPELVCGLIQINATIPADLGAGAQPVVVTIGNNSNASQNVTVAVQ